MAKKNNNGMAYVEPADYFPEELRKKYKYGDYDDEVDADEEKIDEE